MSEGLIGGPPDLAGVVKLSVPALPDFARVARVAIAGLATRAGFTYDEIEDLRIAMGEVCALLVDATADDAQLDITFAITGSTLVVEAVGLAPDRASGPNDLREPELSARILNAVVDSHRMIANGVTFTKHHQAVVS